MPEPLFLSGGDVPPYLHDIELMGAGVNWHASTGDVTITSEHLADAVRACNEDPHIVAPRIRLGHTSPLNGDAPQHNPFAALGDAEPAFGTFSNLRLANDGAVLVGDVDRIVTWLGASAPATYPSRSAEAVWAVEAVDFDVRTPGGKVYQMVITAIAFLGVQLPAIADLEDLSTLITSGPAALAAKRDDRVVTAQLTAAASELSVSTDTIYWRCDEWLMSEGPGSEMYMWWPREIRVDADGTIFLVVDKNDGHTVRIDVDTDGKERIEYAIGGEVRDEVVPVAASRLVASFARPSKPSRPPANAASTAATERPNPEGGTTVDDDVREILVGQGLDPDTATDEQVNAASVLAAAATINPPATTEPEGQAPEGAGNGEPEGEGTTEPQGQREPEPVAASRQVPDGAVVIDAAELATLRAGAEAGTRLAKEKADEKREATLAKASTEGRFPPARLAHYRLMWDKDPEGTETLLTADEKDGGLAKGTVPLAAKAAAPDPEGVGDDGMTAADRELLAASRSRMGFKVGQEA